MITPDYGHLGCVIIISYADSQRLSKPSHKIVSGNAEYYIFPVSGDSRIQYAQTRFGTIGCTIRVNGSFTTIGTQPLE